MRLPVVAIGVRTSYLDFGEMENGWRVAADYGELQQFNVLC